MLRELDLEIAQLLTKAEDADGTPLENGLLSVSKEIARCEQEKWKAKNRLIVIQRVSQATDDEQNLVENVQAIDSVIASVEAALVDSGFVSEQAIREMKGGCGEGPRRAEDDCTSQVPDPATQRCKSGKKIKIGPRLKKMSVSERDWSINGL